MLQEDQPAPMPLSESPQFQTQRERRGFRPSAGIGNAASFNPRRQSTAIFRTMDLASAGEHRAHLGTVRFGSTTKVPAKRVSKCCRIPCCFAADHGFGVAEALHVQDR